MHHSHIHMPILSVVCNGFKRTEWLHGWELFRMTPMTPIEIVEYQDLRFHSRLAAYRPIQVSHKGVTTQWCSHLHQFLHMKLWPCREMSRYSSWDVFQRVECCNLGFESFMCFDSIAYFCSLWYSICYYFFWILWKPALAFLKKKLTFLRYHDHDEFPRRTHFGCYIFHIYLSSIPHTSQMLVELPRV